MEWHDDDVRELTVSNGLIETAIITSDEHSFYVLGKGFIPASELKANDQVVNLDYQVLTVVSNKRLDEAMPMYNFEVADYHTYAVSEQNVWVHNDNDCLPDVNRVVNTNASHAVDQAMGVRGLGFSSRSNANNALQALKSDIKKNGWPEGTIMHYTKEDVLVPYGNGYTVYEIKNGRATLKTAIDKAKATSYSPD